MVLAKTLCCKKRFTVININFFLFLTMKIDFQLSETMVLISVSVNHKEVKLTVKKEVKLLTVSH